MLLSQPSPTRPDRLLPRLLPEGFTLPSRRLPQLNIGGKSKSQNGSLAQHAGSVDFFDCVLSLRLVVFVRSPTVDGG